MNFDFQFGTEKGPFRRNNEDAIRCGKLGQLGCAWMVVADGMGGHKAGEIASQMLVESVERTMLSIKSSQDLDGHQIVIDALASANSSIYDTANIQTDYQGMGTTAVFALCIQQTLYLAWVGDSRIYRLRKGLLEQLSQDHTMIQMLLDKGAISEQEAARSNTKHLLSRAIGVQPTVEIDYRELNVEDKDVLLLSTDGVHDCLPDALLAGYLVQVSTQKNIARKIIKEAIEMGSKDNLTLGIIQVKS